MHTPHFAIELLHLGGRHKSLAVGGIANYRASSVRLFDGESISLENYVPTKYGYTFKGWFTDPRTNQNRVTTFKFTKTDVLYAKWEKNPEEPINPNDEIMSKDTCYLTDEETKIRNEIIEDKNKAYIDGFGYVAPSKTKTIIVDSDGDINKMVGTME